MEPRYVLWWTLNGRCDRILYETESYGDAAEMAQARALAAYESDVTITRDGNTIAIYRRDGSIEKG